MQIMKRAEAAEQGLTKYSTGISCIHGHFPLRYVNSGMCVGCIKMKARDRKTKLRKLRNVKLSGKIIVEVQVYPENAVRIREFASAIDLASELSNM